MFIFFIGILVLIILVTIFLLLSYKKAKPDEALVISGLRKTPKFIIGKSGFSIPFLQRMDKLSLKLIQIDVRSSEIPTKEFININVDAVANVQIPAEEQFVKVASQNFLNKSEEYIRDVVREVLEGNMREIVGQLELRSLVNRRDEFNEKVQLNVVDDMSRIGLKIVNFNVQNFSDQNNAINDLGIDNLVKIQKDAKIAKANAERDVEIEIARASQEGNLATVESKKKIAEQNRDLDVSISNAKAISETERAKAEAAFEIQKEIQQKTINENQIDAETAKAEKMLALKEKEIELKERELDAVVRKQADAERYAVEQKAAAEKTRRIANAEAEKEEKLLKAAGIRAEGEAEADAIRAKKIAEAEGIEKLAEAQAKMEGASIVQMIVDKLPEIAENISTPLSNIDKITLYDPNGTTKLLESGTKNVEQVFNIAKSAGIDINSIISGFTSGLAVSNIKKSNKDNK